MRPYPRQFTEFPGNKKNLTPDQYLHKANAGNPIRSSIPDALEQGRRAATAAENTVTRLRNLLASLGLAAFVALVVALVALYFQVHEMVQNSISLSTSVQQSLAPLSADTESTANRLAATKDDVDELKHRLDQVSSELQAIKQERAVVPRPRANPQKR